MTRNGTRWTRHLLTVGVAVATAAALVACDSAPEADTGSTESDAPQVADLTTEEIDGLLWMREEELVARDLYAALGDQWNVRIFDNIVVSEQRHADEVLALLDTYGVVDPATGTAGDYTSPQLQALYDDLLAQGLSALDEAFTVGVTVETTDIADLQARATTTADIDLVYSNLEAGSERHLAAFERQLAR
jgi:hypothetical protein